LLKVLLPSKNKKTGGYSSSHKAYDFDDIPDKNYYSSLFGTVVQAKNSETKSWRNTGKLTTRDYGNYIKIKGEIDGKTIFQLGAHFQPGTVLPKGTKVKRGQVVAQAGRTGNVRALHGGDGSHSHTEYRDGNEKNIPVVFVKNGVTDKKEMEKLPKDSIIRDIYKSIRGDYPHDDEVARWLQENKNLQEIIDGVMRGDGKVKPRWLKIWEVKEIKDQIAENFGKTLEEVNELLRPVDIKIGDKSEIMLAKIQELVDFKLKTDQETKPQLVIKIGKEDFKHFWRFGDAIIGILGDKTSEKLKGGDKDE
jgi:hypothetical protein